MGLLSLVFLVLGVGGGGRFPDAFKGARTDAVVSTGAHAMTGGEYRKIFEQQKQRYEEQSKQQVTVQFLIQNGFDQQLLNQIALDQGQAEMLSRAGIVPDPSLIDAQIKQIPVAFDRVTGKFSEKQFEDFLASQGLTPREVQSDLTDELAQRHFGYAIAQGFQAPRAYAAMSAIAALQQRDVSYFLLGANAVVQPAQPTDDQLQAFLKLHAAQLMRPEMRAISLVRFSAADMAGGVTVSPADIQKEFDFRKESLSSPETRVIVQVPVKSAADGAAAASRLSRGEDPTAVAKAFGAEAVIYSDKPRSAIADAKIAAAAFAMKEGQVSGPVQGDLGLAAIKVVKVTPAKVAMLDSVKDKIESDLKTKAAKNKAYELSQKFDDARQAGASVAAAAQKVGVPVVAIAPFTADGADGQGKPNPQLLDKIVKSAFTMKAGEESDVQDAGSGEYYALKLEKVMPPALPALAEVRPQLAQAYVREQLVATLKTKADALMDDLRKGGAIDKAAASVGAQVTHQQGMQLIQVEQYKTLGRDFLTGLFGHKAGDVFAAGGPDGVFVARIDAVRAGDVTTIARFLESIRARASQDYLRDLLNDTKSAAAHMVQVNVNLNLARQTMGVDPATVGGGAQKDGGQAK